MDSLIRIVTGTGTATVHAEAREDGFRLMPATPQTESKDGASDNDFFSVAILTLITDRHDVVIEDEKPESSFKSPSCMKIYRYRIHEENPVEWRYFHHICMRLETLDESILVKKPASAIQLI